MPVLGLGVAELSDDETERAVSAALEIGCRLIDTAYAYGNEAAVGRAIAASGVAREELFVTTKLATPDQGFTRSQEACRASLDRLGLDYVDLYLIHWPAPPVGKYVDAWGGMIQSRGEGHARSIGVSTSPRSTSKTLSTSHSSRRRSTRSSCTRCSTRTNCAKLTPSTPSSHSPTAPGTRQAAGQPNRHINRQRIRQDARTSAAAVEPAIGQCGGRPLGQTRAHRQQLRRLRLRVGGRTHGCIGRAQ